ncbi:MAG: PA14 domain-containing protein, partial [Candidatus Omnitrophica bacterium]|nr:PA14 domain-containing protein [Candidatus Omnitrophota bacterium]
LSDDGVRLWVNGKQLINNWTNHAAMENSGSITLTAGQKYDLVMEYYDYTGTATAGLLWSCPRTTKQPVPQSQLYPDISAPGPVRITDALITSLRIAWQDNSDNETGFRVERKTGAAGAYAPVMTTGANTTSWLNSGLAAETEYFYRICALKSSGASEYSPEVGMKTFPIPAAVYHFDSSANAGLDSSTFNNTLALNNGAGYTAAGRSSGGLSLASGTAYAEAAHSASLAASGNQLSLCAWVWFDTTTTGYRETILAKQVQATADVSPYFAYALHRLADGRVRFWVTADGKAKSVVGDTLSAARWYYICGVYDGAQLRLYVDGAPSGNAVAAQGSVSSYATPLRLGVKINSTPVEGMRGKVDGVRVYNRALTPAQIEFLSTSGK